MSPVAVLERFATPSRRYASVSGAESARPPQTVFDLFGLRHLAPLIPRAAASWLGPSLPVRAKFKLLAACLRTRGSRTTRLGAVIFAPGLSRRIRAGEIDRVACFSAKGFGLARALAEESGRPCEELLMRGTQYFGELAFELLAVIPYAYWLYKQGRLEFTASTPDTRCLYTFSPNHVEVPTMRVYVPITEYPLGDSDRRRYDRHGFPTFLDEAMWCPPPYKQIHGNDVFRWQREMCVVSNKTSAEAYMQEGRPLNSLDNELLLEVIGRLRPRYQVVYNRPRALDIPNDGGSPTEQDDIQAVKRAHPDVLSIQEIATQHPQLTFNELQMKVYANCRRFVSVLGGGSYLASYFGGTNVVFARRGWEVRGGAYENWFHLFSGARVVRASTPAELVAAVDRELL